MEKNIVVVQAEMVRVWAEEERLSTARLTISEVVKPEIEGIDKQRKSARENAVKLCESIGVAVDAAAAVSGILPKGTGDATVDKRASRARKWWIDRLSMAYPAYDFSVETSRIGKSWNSRIIAEYIGDSAGREASELYVAYSRVCNLLDIPVAAEITSEVLARALRTKNGQSAPSAIEHGSLVSDAMLSIAGRVASLMPPTTTATATATGTTTRKAAK